MAGRTRSISWCETMFETQTLTKARCLACLRALWSSTQPLTGGEPFDGFSLCIVGPSIEMFEAQAAPCQAPRYPLRHRELPADRGCLCECSARLLGKWGRLFILPDGVMRSTE